MTKPTKWVWAQRGLRSAWAQAFFMRTAKTLIRLGGCPGWSESSLGAHSHCWFCHVAAFMLFFFKGLSWFKYTRSLDLRRLMTNPTKWHVRPAKPQISLGPVCSESSLAQSVQSLRCSMRKAQVLSYPLSAPRILWSDWVDWVDAQAGLSLRWAQRSLCWFCHEAAHL